MKFAENDEVRVTAWCMPGVNANKIEPYHLVCGKTGRVTAVSLNDSHSNSDGVYRVQLYDISTGRKEWWFRACDLVAIDLPCSCVNTVDRIPIGECLIHDHPDQDPVAEAAGKLQALVEKLDHGEEE